MSNLSCLSAYLNIEKIELMTDNVYYYPENFSLFENLKTLVIKHDVFFSFVEHDCCNKIIKIPYNFFPNLENLEYHCQKITNIDTYNQKYGKEFTSSHTYGMWFDIFTIMTIFKNLKNFTLVDCYYILYSLNAKIYENREYGIHMEKYDYLENYNDIDFTDLVYTFCKRRRAHFEKYEQAL